MESVTPVAEMQPGSIRNTTVSHPNRMLNF